jgi:LSD1 subclass zinc finger protein
MHDIHAISQCPKCRQPVSLPSETEPAETVRCPLCQAEYPLGEAIPPTLIPVGVPAASPVEWTQQENEAAAVAGPVSLGMTHLHRRKTKAWWRAPLEVLCGAVFGALIAYYALAVWLGPELKTRGFPVFTCLPGISSLTATPAGGERDVKAEK